MNWNKDSQYIIVKGLADVINKGNYVFTEPFNILNEHLKEFGLEIGPIKEKSKLCQCSKTQIDNIKLESNIGKTIVKILIKILAVDDTDINIDTNLYKDLYIDELDIVEIVMELEKQFKININDAEAETLSTVREIISFIESKIYV